MRLGGIAKIIKKTTRTTRKQLKLNCPKLSRLSLYIKVMLLEIEVMLLAAEVMLLHAEAMLLRAVALLPRAVTLHLQMVAMLLKATKKTPQAVIACGAFLCETHPLR